MKNTTIVIVQDTTCAMGSYSLLPNTQFKTFTRVADKTKWDLFDMSTALILNCSPRGKWWSNMVD